MSDTEPDAAALAAELATLKADTAARLVRAELKAEALRAGILDLDGLKLLDTSALQLADDDTLPGAADALATLKRNKPWLFANPTTSHPAPPPRPTAPEPRNATDMTYKEWQTARLRLLRGA